MGCGWTGQSQPTRSLAGVLLSPTHAVAPCAKGQETVRAYQGPWSSCRIKNRFSSSSQILVLCLTYSAGISRSETRGFKKIPWRSQWCGSIDQKAFAILWYTDKKITEGNPEAQSLKLIVKCGIWKERLN